MGVITGDVIGLAILGLGRAGTIHFKNSRNSARASVKYLVDTDVGKCNDLVAKYRLKETVAIKPEQIDQVVEDPEVHGAIVCTVTYSHEEYVLKFLRAGKAVFCEKPISETYEGTENCYKEAEEHGSFLLCAFNRRFDPTHIKVREGVKAGRIGQLQMVKTSSRDSPLPSIDYLKISGGIFHDCGIHDIDLIMWIVGEVPTTVYAQAHAFHSSIAELNDVDTVAITMKFPSGVIAQIDLSRFAAYGYDQRLEAFGSNGMLQSQNAPASSVCFSDNKGVQDDVYMFSFPQRFAESYVNELDHFFDVIEGRPCSVKKEEALMACKVASACQESFKTGKPVCIEV